MNRRMDRRQQGRRQPGRVGVDRMGPMPRGTFVNHTQQALMRSHLAPSHLDQFNAYMELARQGMVHGPAVRGPGIPSPGPAIPLLSSGQGFYTVESLQGATSVSQGIPPPQSHLVAPERSRMMGFGAPGVRQGYDSGMGNMHMMMNPIVSHEMLANGHPHLGSPLVAITSRPQQGLLGPIFANGPVQHPHHPHVPLGFHPGRPSSGPALLPGWPQERDQGQGWGWDNRDGVRDVKGDWNRRHWEGHREPRPVERLPSHGRKGRAKRNKQPSPAAKQGVAPGNDKKRKFPNALGPGGPGWCTLCELECSTAEMLQQHRYGKRHKRHLQNLELHREGAKEKANSSNSSVNVVTSQGDVSNGPGTAPCMQDATETDLDKTKADAESAELQCPPIVDSVAGSPGLEVEHSKPAEQGEREGDLKEEYDIGKVLTDNEGISKEGQNQEITKAEGEENLEPTLTDLNAEDIVMCTEQAASTA